MGKPAFPCRERNARACHGTLGCHRFRQAGGEREASETPSRREGFRWRGRPAKGGWTPVAAGALVPLTSLSKLSPARCCGRRAAPTSACRACSAPVYDVAVFLVHALCDSGHSRRDHDRGERRLRSIVKCDAALPLPRLFRWSNVWKNASGRWARLYRR